MAGSKPSGVKVSDSQREFIDKSFQEGKTADEISKETGIPIRNVLGRIKFTTGNKRVSRNHRVTGELVPSKEQIAIAEQIVAASVPPQPPQAFVSVVAPEEIENQNPETELMTTTPQSQVQTPSVQQSSVQVVQAPRISVPPADFAWKPLVSGANAAGNIASIGGAIPFSGSEVKIFVYRTSPSNDGLLGSHPSNVGPEDIARTYGSGVYQLVRQEPGKLPQQSELTVSDSYGEPRTPRRGPVAQRVQFDQRQSQDQNQNGNFPRWGNSPSDRVVRPTESLKDMVDATSKLVDLAKATAPQAPVQVSAESPFVKMTEKAMDMATGGNMLKDLLSQQQQRWEEERRNERERYDREKREADERRDREKREADERWQKFIDLEQARSDRARKDAADAHEREMQRLKVENENRLRLEADRNKAMLDLEDRKNELLKKQIDLDREAIKKQTEALQKKIEEEREATQDFIERERERDKEFLALREKMIDAHEKNEREKLEILKKSNESVTSENMIWGTIKEALGKVNERIAGREDVQKLQILVDEAKRRGVTVDQLTAELLGGNVKQEAVPAPAARSANGNGNGHDKETAVALVDKYFQTAEFKEIVAEWTGLVSANRTPISFAEAFLTWMSADDQPAIKRAATTFNMFMDSRDWAAMKTAMWPHISEDQKKVFDADVEKSEAFYETFKAYISQQLQAYAEQFFAARAQIATQVQQQTSTVEKEESVQKPRAKARVRVVTEKDAPTGTQAS